MPEPSACLGAVGLPEHRAWLVAQPCRPPPLPAARAPTPALRAGILNVVSWVWRLGRPSLPKQSTAPVHNGKGPRGPEHSGPSSISLSL